MTFQRSASTTQDVELQHVIGEIFDRAYRLAFLTTEPLSDVQTITFPRCRGRHDDGCSR